MIVPITKAFTGFTVPFILTFLVFQTANNFRTLFNIYRSIALVVVDTTFAAIAIFNSHLIHSGDPVNIGRLLVASSVWYLLRSMIINRSDYIAIGSVVLAGVNIVTALLLTAFTIHW